MATVSPDSVAQDQIRAFVERIMRLREEVKAINGDIREVYAEAKGNGFDKTVLGKVVNYIEKRATSAGELAEGEALFDLYLAAFDGATRVGTSIATHTHEAASYDRLTGEVRDETERAPSSAQPHPEAKATKAEPSRHAQGAGTEGVASRASVGAGSDASITVPRHEVEEADEGEVTPPASSADIPEPAEAAPPASAGHGDRGAVVPSAAPVVAGNVMTFRTHNPETHFLNSTGLLRLHGCLKPELCGSSEPRKRLCFDCSRLHDGPVHQDQAEAG